MREVNITFGPPGTGKTTAMLNKIEDHLKNGIKPEKIAFVSYTKKAVQEAAARAGERFGLDPKSFKNFRTIHSTAYHAMGTRRNEMMNKEDYTELGNILGLKFTQRIDANDGAGSGEMTGGYMLQLMNLARARKVSLREIWSAVDQDIDWFKLKQVNDTITQYKNDFDKVDFDDLLDDFVTARPALDLDVAIIDEAQDLSNAQWDVAKIAFRKAGVIEIAGDDDQAIYAWSGANVERFLNIKGNRVVLNKSYRLPRSVFNLSHQIIKRVGYRYAKEWAPRDEQGSVQFVNEPDQINFEDDWLMLARNSWFLKDMADACEYRGIPYTFRGRPSIDQDDVRAIVLYNRKHKGDELAPDDQEHLDRYVKEVSDKPWFDAIDKIPVKRREYYLSVLRNGNRLQDEPKIHINTIHGVKGGEATNVLLCTDMTLKSHEAMNIDADNEHRVFYVGATRAKKNLFIMQPRTDRGYQI